jgi:hypothetical protein
MNLKKIIDTMLDDHAGCFGNFNIKDPVCRRKCALNIRCCIQYCEATRIEIIEDMFSSDYHTQTFQ